MRSIERRLKFAAIASAVLIAAFGFINSQLTGSKTNASASGPSPSHTGAPGESNCTECHSTFPVNSGSGNAQITGLPKNYLPGQQIAVTVTVNQSDGVIFGFQMTALNPTGGSSGTYTLPAGVPPTLQLDSGPVNGQQREYIEHTVNGITPTQFGTKSWTFTWTAPSRRVGKLDLFAAGNAADSDGGTGGDRIYTTSSATLSGTAISSFDNDGKSEVAVFRPEEGRWYSVNSTDANWQVVQWGTAGDIPAPGDFDGDGTTDRTVFRPSDGTWYMLQSSNGTSFVKWGTVGDIPVPGDYDGDLKTDPAIYRPADGRWYILKSTGGVSVVSWGLATDLTAQGDYDGDAITDIAVFRPSTGYWYILRSSDGLSIYHWGTGGDRPVPGDYDGDGKHDISLYRPSTGQWWIIGSTVGITSIHFGIAEDKAVSADYDGDGKTDIAVFRPSSGTWYILRSSDNSEYVTQYGAGTDIPIPAGYIAPQ